MLVVSTPTNTLCSLAGWLRRPQARLLVFCTLLKTEFRHRLLLPEAKCATKCNKIRQGQWYCTGCQQSEVTGEYAVTWENKIKYTKSLNSSCRDSIFGAILVGKSRQKIVESFRSSIGQIVESFRSSKNTYGSPLQVHGRAIGELDEVCANIHDRMMLVRQRSCDHIMSWRRFWWFLGQNSSFKMAQWFAMVSRAQNWLHRRTGVLTRVYVHFLR